MAIYDTIIIGGGSTGFSAAMYAGRLNLKTLVLVENMGGTLTIAGNVENWPGIKSIDGYDLADKIKEHAMEYDIEVIEKRATEIKKDKALFTVKTQDQSFQTKTIIIATGTKVKKLDIKGEDKFANKGVHYCALCDGPLYKQKTLCVVGGGDSAAKGALVLSEWGKKVYLIYRGDKITPEPVNMKRIEKKVKENKIEIITNTNLIEINGKDKVTSILLDRPANKKMDMDGIFIEIGHIPLSDLVKPLGVKTNQKGEIIIDKNANTNIPGIFAAGDVVDGHFKQAITGSAEGVLAAYSAYEFVNKA